jgi:hypothetical protein
MTFSFSRLLSLLHNGIIIPMCLSPLLNCQIFMKPGTNIILLDATPTFVLFSLLPIQRQYELLRWKRYWARLMHWNCVWFSKKNVLLAWSSLFFSESETILKHAYLPLTVTTPDPQTLGNVIWCGIYTQVRAGCLAIVFLNHYSHCIKPCHTF